MPLGHVFSQRSLVAAPIPTKSGHFGLRNAYGHIEATQIAIIKVPNACYHDAIQNSTSQQHQVYAPQESRSVIMPSYIPLISPYLHGML